MRRALAFAALLLTASWSRADDPIVRTYELADSFEIRVSEDGVPGPADSNRAAVLLMVDADGSRICSASRARGSARGRNTTCSTTRPVSARRVRRRASVIA